MIKKQLTLFICLLILGQASAQELLTPSMTFSKKKTAYITLTDGTEIEGLIKDIDRKKGLVDYVKIKDNDGKKHKLDADKIAYMYLAPSGFDKLVKASNFLTDAEKWGSDEKLNNDLLNQGYVFLENSKVRIKKKTRTLLMQLLNPTFSGKIKIYHDPMAKETMSVGIGPVKMAGGDAKSYFFKVGDKAAYKIKKKEYKKEFPIIWKSCKAVKKEFGKKIKWSELTKHVVTYNECAK